MQIHAREEAADAPAGATLAAPWPGMSSMVVVRAGRRGWKRIPQV
jgi:hypothetical protein